MKTHAMKRSVSNHHLITRARHALPPWLAILALVAGLTYPAWAVIYTNTATGNYNASIWQIAGNPSGTTADDVTVGTGTVTMNLAYQATNDVITLNNPGVLTLANNQLNTLSGATVLLNGGRINWIGVSGASYGTIGGTLQVMDNSTLSTVVPNLGNVSVGGTLAFDALNFLADGKTLILSNFNSSGGTGFGNEFLTNLFNQVTVTNNATVALKFTPASSGANYTNFFNVFSNVTLSASKTLTLTNSGAVRLEFTFKGNNAGMMGSVDIRSNITVTASDNNALGNATLTVAAGAALVGNASGGFGSATVTVNAGGTARSAASNSFGTATVTVNSGGTLNANVAFGLGTSTNIINSGARLVADPLVDSTLAGAVIRLNGGTLNWIGVSGGADRELLGGNVEVMDNSTIATHGVNGTGGYPPSQDHALTFESLNFLADGKTLTLTNFYSDGGGRTLNHFFQKVTVTNNATLAVAWHQAAGGALHANVLSNATIAAGKTLTVTNVATQLNTVNLEGSNPGMAGSLVIRSNITFNVNGNNGLGSANVTVHQATLNPNVSNAFGSATVTVNGALLTSSVAYGLGTSTVTLNNGSRLLLNNTAPNNYLAGTTIRLNGGTLDATISGAAGTVNVGGALQVFASSTITNTAPNQNTAPHRTLIYDSLSFAADGTTLTLFAGNYNGVSLQFTQQFNSVSIPYNTTIALTHERSTLNNSPGPATLFSNVTLAAGKTLTVTNRFSTTNDRQARMVLAGNNAGLAGSMDIGSNVTVLVREINSLGNAGTVTVRRGGTLTAAAFVTGWSGGGTLGGQTTWHTDGGHITLGGANNSIATIGANAGVILENGGTLSQLNGTSPRATGLTVDGELHVRGTSTLAFNNTLTLAVASGGLLGGSGTISGGATTLVQIQNGGSIAPGASPGTLTVPDLTLAAGANYLWEHGDLLVATGDLNLTAVTWNLYLDSLGRGFQDGGSIKLFTFGTLVGTPEDPLVYYDPSFIPSGLVQLEQIGNSLYLTGVSVIPESSTLLLFGVGGWVLVRIRRRG